jgi:hypothetical protein
MIWFLLFLVIVIGFKIADLSDRLGRLERKR